MTRTSAPIRYRRHELVTLVRYFQFIMEHQIGCPLAREVLYEFTVKIYKRLIDSGLKEFRVVYHYKDALAFAKCYFLAGTGCLEAYDTFSKLDQVYELTNELREAA